MSENTPDFHDTMKFLNKLADTYFDVVGNIHEERRQSDADTY